ncbi:MAG: biotin-dependent carboxyltransferase family protein [Clostridia bacterium]|nr:biotin-dependent carboxyltransferase family protein [Clostridia bacterium]
MTKLKVVNPGMYSTIQDLGRKSYQQYGMPVAGSMDDYAHRVANLLVGNAAEATVIEQTALGGVYQFTEKAVISITGGDMMPKRNGEESLKMWRTLVMHPGDTLSFGAAQNGFRCYLAVAGGFDVPTVLKSKATYVRGGLGGFEGRILKKGDEIAIGASTFVPMDLAGRFVRVSKIPTYEEQVTLHVILGPQEDCFTRKGIADFFGNVYTVSGESDRMGYRLEGEKVAHVSSADIISDGIIRGAVQIPGHGNPIIMLSDCQTTGGYTKIAHVITSDLWKVAQLKAGNCIRFKAVDIETAHELLKEEANIYREIEAEFDQYRIEGYQALAEQMS